MKKIKCLECGEEFSTEMSECSNCGCPLQTTQVQVHLDSSDKPNIEKTKILKKDFFPYISLTLGVIILLIGIFVMNQKNDVETYSTKNYDVPRATFGGDFYTEIYNASDIIADELNEINGGIEHISRITSSVVNVIYFSSGMIIIALGLSTIAVSCLKIKHNKIVNI